MSRRLELWCGDEALDRLRRPEWRGRWRRAAELDPKSTWFQEDPFVLSWYRAYEGVYEPVVAVEHDDHEISGLLAAARRIDDGSLVHAGANHAWYHGWVAIPGAENFAADATAAILDRWRPRHWRWKFLPPGADPGWCDGAGFGAVVTEHRSAVWDLREPDAISRHESRGLRNYRNRYLRAGELVLDRLEDTTAIRRVLAVLAPWCDLRHGAIHADLPFRDDPRKLPFHERLAGSDPSVQTHVLRLDDRPLAVHLGAFDGTRLFLGLHGYDPTEGRQSPGTILLLELAAAIRAQGGSEIDMTPGGEPWKERYASRHRQTFQVDVYGGATRHALRAIGNRITGFAKGALESVGIAPEDVRKAVAGGRGDEAAPPPVLYEIDRQYLGHVGAVTEDEDEGTFDGVDAPWLERLLSYDRAHERTATSHFLSLALRLLDKGWRPLCGTGTTGNPTVAWLQPPDTRALLPDDGAAPPRLVRGRLEPKAERRAVPADAALLLLAEDGGGSAGHPLPLLVEAARLSGKSRIWVAALDAAPGTREWFLKHGRQVGGAERAA